MEKRCVTPLNSNTGRPKLFPHSRFFSEKTTKGKKYTAEIKPPGAKKKKKLHTRGLKGKGFWGGGGGGDLLYGLGGKKPSRANKNEEAPQRKESRTITPPNAARPETKMGTGLKS